MDGAPKELTNSQLNKIGERIRKNSESEDDLRLLDQFRSSFEGAYQEIFNHLDDLGLKPGGRQGKTTESIRAKLLREKTRLSKMQDIAGCRVEVDHMLDQDLLVDKLKSHWPNSILYDRRITPSSGYRAVHLVVEVFERLVEIQVRTSLQHSWASVTEKLADVYDPQIKYGGGPEFIQKHLQLISTFIAEFESLEREYWETRRKSGEPESERAQNLRIKMNTQKDKLKTLCEQIIMRVP